MEQIIDSLAQFWQFTGFANCTWQHLVMLVIGLVFITLGIVKEWEPLLLVPIGFGIIIGNIPIFQGLNIGIYEQGSVLNILYQGVRQGWYPPLIFLGIGAMTDFSALISQPRLMLIGAAAQMGIFGAYLLALAVGFMPNEAGAIGIIGGADGPTAIFLSSKLAPELMGAIAALEALNRPCTVSLWSDSKYLISAFNEHWLENWVRKNWMRTRKEPVKNVDLWKRLLAAAAPHTISWFWVKGHSGMPQNERGDALATAAADSRDLIPDPGLIEENASETPAMFRN